MAGISQAGMQQQQISQVQVQSLGAMRRQIPQNVNSTRDFGRQVVLLLQLCVLSTLIREWVDQMLSSLVLLAL